MLEVVVSDQAFKHGFASTVENSHARLERFRLRVLVGVHLCCRYEIYFCGCVVDRS